MNKELIDLMFRNPHLTFAFYGIGTDELCIRVSENNQPMRARLIGSKSVDGKEVREGKWDIVSYAAGLLTKQINEEREKLSVPGTQKKI